MEPPRWPIVAGVVVLVALAAVGGWAVGDSTDSGTSAQAPRPSASNDVRSINGVAVGVSRSRSGALAASDNYVAESSESLLQDPPRYARLVRAVYASGYRADALRDAARARVTAPDSVELYASGGKSIAVIAARRLDSYSGGRADTTTWVAGVTWGPGRVPGHTWSLVRTVLHWSGDRWRVMKLGVVRRAAPAPQRLGYRLDEQLKTATFDRELRGMTAPVYGGV